jgi:hypothetical protein
MTRKESFMFVVRWSSPVCIVLLSAAVVVAKPPDLPDKGTIRCATALQQTNGPGSSDAVLPVIDAWCPDLMPTLVDRIYYHLRAALGTASRPNAAATRDSSRTETIVNQVDMAVDPESTEDAVKAEAYFRLALRLLRAGNIEAARIRLRQAHSANPTCHFGQLAIQRLLELEAMDQVDEPPSDPQADRSIRDLRERTIPLGTVQVRTY